MAKSMKTDEKIFRSAMSSFIKNGKHGAKMQEIADRAEINKAMLFYYFKNKEGLYAHVFETVLQKVFGSLHTFFNEQTPFTISLRLFIDHYMDMVSSNPQIPMFVLRELGAGDETAMQVINKLTKEGRFELPNAFIESARKAVENGDIKEIDPIHLMFSVLGATNYFFLAEPLMKPFLESQQDFSRQDFLLNQKHNIFDLVYHGIHN